MPKCPLCSAHYLDGSALREHLYGDHPDWVGRRLDRENDD